MSRSEGAVEVEIFPSSGVAKPGPTRALAWAMLGRAWANIFIILKI